MGVARFLRMGRRRRVVPARHRGPALPAVVFLCAYVTLLLAIPSQLIFRPLGAPGTPANMLGMGALLWWTAARIGGHLSGRARSPVRIMLGVLLLCVLASYAAGSIAGWYAPSNMRQRTDDVWTLSYPAVDQVAQAMVTAVDRGLLSFAGWLGVALMTLDGLRDWADVQRLVRWLSWSAGVVAGVGIFQFYTGTNLASFIEIPGLVPNSDVGMSLTRSVLNRVSATSGHPIEFGVVASTLFPCALHTALFRRNRWDLLPVFLIGFAAPLAVSRSGILTLGLGLIVMFLGWPRGWRRRGLFLTPVLVVAMRVIVPGLVGTIYSLFRGISDDPSVTGRTADYGVVLDLYGQHPWLGRGLFTFIPRFYRILDTQYLMLLVELGLVGLVVVLSLAVTGVHSALSARRQVRHRPRDAHVGLAVAAGAVGMFVSYITFDAWGYSQTAGLSFLLLGLAGAVHRLARDVGAVAAEQPPATRLSEASV